MKLKLYVWECFAINFSCGLAFAVAENVERARVLLTQQDSDIASDLAAEPDVYELDKPIGFFVVGGG